jgi:hypothetical protein
MIWSEPLAPLPRHTTSSFESLYAVRCPLAGMHHAGLTCHRRQPPAATRVLVLVHVHVHGSLLCMVRVHCLNPKLYRHCVMYVLRQGAEGMLRWRCIGSSPGISIPSTNLINKQRTHPSKGEGVAPAVCTCRTRYGVLACRTHCNPGPSQPFRAARGGSSNQSPTLHCAEGLGGFSICVDFHKCLRPPPPPPPRRRRVDFSLPSPSQAKPSQALACSALLLLLPCRTNLGRFDHQKGSSQGLTPRRWIGYLCHHEGNGHPGRVSKSGSLKKGTLFAPSSLALVPGAQIKVSRNGTDQDWAATKQDICQDSTVQCCT